MEDHKPELFSAVSQFDVDLTGLRVAQCVDQRFPAEIVKINTDRRLQGESGASYSDTEVNFSTDIQLLRNSGKRLPKIVNLLAWRPHSPQGVPALFNYLPDRT